MIYSPAFKALPDAPKALVMRHIDRVLSGELTGDKYAAFTLEVRTAIREILGETLEPSR
jgi:hypothetical protein